MKLIITTIILLLSPSVFAQYPDASPETPAIRMEAKRLTKIYDAKLGLDGLQLPIFTDIVEDYLVLAEKAKAKLEGKEALNKLTALMVKESLEMKDLLTRIQYNEYKKIRQDIQPLKTLKRSNGNK